MITPKPHPASPIEPSKQLISRRELAHRWCCCIETIKNRERAGILKSIRFGPRFLRYRLSDVLAIETTAGGNEQ